MPQTEMATVVPKMLMPEHKENNFIKKKKFSLLFKDKRGDKPTLYKAQCSKHAQFQVCVNLGAVNNGVVGPHAEPVVVGQRDPLLKSVQEDDGDDDGQANGVEVLLVHFQPHLLRQMRHHSLFSPLNL